MSAVTTTPATAATSPVPSLTSVFVRLKLSLLRNGLRQSGGRTAAYIVSIVFGVVLAAGTVLSFVLLRGSADAGTIAVLMTGVTALSWAVMPLFVPGGDETLDPSRLVMLPLRPRPLIRALFVASLVGVGPVLTLFLAFGAALSVAHGAAATVAAVVAVPLTVAVCVALSRAVAAANIRLLTSRKGRDLALLSGLVIAVGIQVVNFGAQRLSRPGGLTALEPAEAVVDWLPPAAAIGAVDAASRGDHVTAAARLLLTAGVLMVLVYWWRRSLERLMVEPDGSTIGAASDAGGREKSSGTGWLARVLPDGRDGAVMERSLRYMWRDPKTKASWVTSLALGLIVPLFNALQGTGSIYWACFASGMLGMLMYNQFGQDTSAFWMVAQTLSTTADAYAELRARALALLAVTLPYATLVTVLTTAVLGDWSRLAEALGLAFALLGAMLATGAVASAFFPYSIPQDSGYKNVAPGQAGLAWISILGGMLTAPLLCAPLIGGTVYLHLSDQQSQLWLLFPAGTLYGALLVWAGLKLAAPRTAGRLPEILAAVSKG